MCSRHFKDGNPKNVPELSLGKRFGSPIKKAEPRAKRTRLRAEKQAHSSLNAESSYNPSRRSTTPVLAVLHHPLAL